jgi:hypothetical protein
MFHLIKFLLWLAAIAIIAFFVLKFFGYDVNMNYFNDSKAACQKRLSDCTKTLIEQGTKNAKCDIMCVDPKLIIKKQ